MTKQHEGRIVQVIGPVVDVEFGDGHVPAVYNALNISRVLPSGETSTLVCEVQQHLGEDRVRSVAMDSTDGLVRGMPVIDTGGPISVPVGPEVLGRMMNITGDSIDGRGEIITRQRLPSALPEPLATYGDKAKVAHWCADINGD